MIENPEEKSKAFFKINVNYQNIIGKKYNSEFVFDFSEFEGMTQLGKPPLHEMADFLKEIKENIKDICSGWKKLNVISYTKEDIREEEALNSARFREMEKNFKKGDDQKEN